MINLLFVFKLLLTLFFIFQLFQVVVILPHRNVMVHPERTNLQTLARNLQTPARNLQTPARNLQTTTRLTHPPPPHRNQAIHPQTKPIDIHHQTPNTLTQNKNQNTSTSSKDQQLILCKTPPPVNHPQTPPTRCQAPPPQTMSNKGIVRTKGRPGSEIYTSRSSRY